MSGPARSELINTPEEARAYYAASLAGARHIDCHGTRVTIVFERWATHLFSTEDPGGQVPVDERVVRQIPGGRVEVRRFSLERARLMDEVLTAVAKFTVSLPGTGPTGREKRMLHGPRLPDGRYLRVVLRPGPGDAFTCVSAYPIEQRVWLEAQRSKRAKFPP